MSNPDLKKKYFSGMQNAYNYALGPDFKLSVADIQKIRELAMPWSNASMNQSLSYWNTLGAFYPSKFPDESGWKFLSDHQVIQCTLNDELKVKDVLQGLVNTFNKDIASATSPYEKAISIATLIGKLDRLHPFKDGNARTNMILMNALFKQYELPFSWYDSPLYTYLR